MRHNRHTHSDRQAGLDRRGGRRVLRWWLTALAAWALASAGCFGDRSLWAQTLTADNATDVDEAADPEGTAFLRLIRDEDKKPVALETAITRYVAADGTRPNVVVDLIGAVHIADPEYYTTLNKRFAEYDAVLYELVAPEGTRVPKGGTAPTSGVSMLQAGMTKALNLTFQLDQIDYTKDYMIHADLSPEEFARSMKERGESFTQIFFRMMAHSMAQQSKSSSKGADVKMLAALFSKNRDYQLKVVLAEQFVDMEGALDVFNGPDGSTLVTVRNARAIEVLQRELRRGKKRLAIFYGAAHMPDMEKRLEKELNLQRQSQHWIEAWDLTPPADQ